jgi:hypothetical protein
MEQIGRSGVDYGPDLPRAILLTRNLQTSSHQLTNILDCCAHRADGGFQRHVPSLRRWMNFTTADRYQSWMSRTW